MKKISFAWMILFFIMLKICTVSADSQMSDAVPTTKTTIERYNDYSIGTVKLTALPKSCFIVMAKYSGSRCVEAEIRKYQTDTEVFNIPAEADTVKVMVWEGLDNIKPVTKVETIDMKLDPELDKKIEAIAKKLKTEKNPNVITYKTEENIPRAVIWTKGINAPQLSDFKRETDPTDSSYTFLYAEQSKGSGWYDVNKSLPDEDGGDRNMCYAAVSANQLHWWLDQNRQNIEEYLSSIQNDELTAEEQEKYAQLKELMNSYESQANSGIYSMFRKYFESQYYAYNADLLNDFFINGYQVNTLGKVNTPDFFKWDPRGGFFYSVFEKNNLTMRMSAGDYNAFKRDVIYYMQDGQSIGIIHNTPTYGVTHIITLWGVEIDHNNEITALFVTDSDDYDQPKVGMKRMLLKKNSSGYPIISTKINDNNSGAKILEMVPLSLGDGYWNAASNNQ